MLNLLLLHWIIRERSKNRRKLLDCSKKVIDPLIKEYLVQKLDRSSIMLPASMEVLKILDSKLIILIVLFNKE